MEFYRFVRNCVEKRKGEEIGETHLVQQASKGCNRSENESN